MGDCDNLFAPDRNLFAIVFCSLVSLLMPDFILFKITQMPFLKIIGQSVTKVTALEKMLGKFESCDHQYNCGGRKTLLCLVSLFWTSLITKHLKKDAPKDISAFPYKSLSFVIASLLSVILDDSQWKFASNFLNFVIFQIGYSFNKD